MVDSVHLAPDTLPTTPKFPYIRETFGFPETSVCSLPDQTANPFMFPIPEIEPTVIDKQLINSSRQDLPLHYKRIPAQLIVDILSPRGSDRLHSDHEIHHQEAELDKAFKIKNLDTGDVIDIRDENQEAFSTNFAKLISHGPGIDLEDYL